MDHPVWPLWAAAITLVWEAYSDIAGSPTIMSVVQPFLGPPGSTIYSSRGSPSPKLQIFQTGLHCAAHTQRRISWSVHTRRITVVLICSFGKSRDKRNPTYQRQLQINCYCWNSIAIKCKAHDLSRLLRRICVGSWEHKVQRFAAETSKLCWLHSSTW